MSGTAMVEAPPIGSRWYAWGEHVEVVEHSTLDGEPALRERLLTGPSAGRLRPTVLVRLFVRRAVPSDHPGRK